MKIAITADVHLTSRSKHPERFHALENILDQLLEQGIETLIVAGDLFDASCTTPGEFEEVIKKKKYSKINLYVIPGNHDPVLSDGTFSLANIHYVTKPVSVQFADSIPFVFIPYVNNTSMGEVLAANEFPVASGSWALVGHGDWLSGTVQKNEYESGTYMPLSNRDIVIYEPKIIFLGHIHAPQDSTTVHYSGSPCALDPTETGFRSFLVFDTSTLKTSRQVVNTDYLFFNEQITILPLYDEESYVKDLLESRIQAWNVPPDQKQKVRVRIKARGYSSDRNQLAAMIREQLKDYSFENGSQPDISQVQVSMDVTQSTIAEQVKKLIDEEYFPQSPQEADRDEIILAAMNTIYGGK